MENKKIQFKSTITQGEEVNKIQFTSPVIISKMADFDVYEFEEPQNKVMNRIEVSSNFVNIFAGVSSINLVHNKDVKIQYSTQHGTLFLTTNMNKLEKKTGTIAFEYTLANDSDIIGTYAIELLIS